jgi:hypothetical protein
MSEPDAAPDNSSKALREYCRGRGITAKTAGQPVDDLIALARAEEDPRGFLDTFAPAEQGIGDSGLGISNPAADASPIPNPQSPIPSAPGLVNIALPVAAQPPFGYLERDLHVDVHFHDNATAIAFRRVWACLRDNHVLLAGGRHVESRGDVFRWVFEQVAEQLK